MWAKGFTFRLNNLGVNAESQAPLQLEFYHTVLKRKTPQVPGLWMDGCAVER
jgi:hypothetical protein